MTELNPAHLSFDQESQSLTASASELGIVPGILGEATVSVKSPGASAPGRVGTYIYSHAVFADDATITAYHYAAASPVAVRATPGGLVIFNG